MDFGERSRTLREKHELTQKDVADHLYTPQSCYAQYENDRRPIPLERVVELAKKYDVYIDYIAGLTDDINRKPR